MIRLNRLKLRVHSQTCLIRPWLICITASPPENGLEQTFPNELLLCYQTPPPSPNCNTDLWVIWLFLIRPKIALGPMGRINQVRERFPCLIREINCLGMTNDRCNHFTRLQLSLTDHKDRSKVLSDINPPIKSSNVFTH